MQIIALATLKAFWQRHPQAHEPLLTWYRIAARAEWQTPADFKRELGASIDFVGDDRVIFDVAGNKYRLIARALYRHKGIQIKFIGDHAEYDKINAETVGR